MVGGYPIPGQDGGTPSQIRTGGTQFRMGVLPGWDWIYKYMLVLSVGPYLIEFNRYWMGGTPVLYRDLDGGTPLWTDRQTRVKLLPSSILWMRSVNIRAK